MVHSEVKETKLVLVSARKSRGADHWDEDDYDVRLGDGSGPVVGRIMLHPQAPKDKGGFQKTMGLQSRLRSESRTGDGGFQKTMVKLIDSREPERRVSGERVEFLQRRYLRSIPSIKFKRVVTIWSLRKNDEVAQRQDKTR
jgi:hypothetical protein